MNDTGTILTCSVRGRPTPKIYWIYSTTDIDNNVGGGLINSHQQTIIPVDGLQQIRQDTLTTSQLIYLPFKANQYRQDLHSITIRCIATNQFGSIQSHNIQIRASVRQPYDIQVYDDFVIKGNIGILRCHIPNFVRENVRITNWLRHRDDNDNDGAGGGGGDQIITSDLLKGGRYSIMPNGDLHVHHIQIDNDNDRLRSTSSSSSKTARFRCQTKHLLTGEIKQSANYGRLIITDAQSRMPPKIITATIDNHSGNHQTNNRKQKVIANLGDIIELPCIVQANPWPTFTWYRINNHQLNYHRNSKFNDQQSSSSLLPIMIGAKKFIQIDSSLFIHDVSLLDNGLYVCIANNSLGQDRIETELIVKASMNVQMIPEFIRATDGDIIQFNCTISIGNNHNNNDYLIDYHIRWYHNTRLLTTMMIPSTTKSTSIIQENKDSRIRLLEHDRILQIRNVGRDDKGMFQCIVSNEFESVQASGELSMADDPPSFVSVFNIPEPLRPGKSLSMKCSAIGTPLPQIIWTLDGQTLIDHGRIRVGDYVSADNIVNSFVNITTLRTEDGGIYSCTASNDIHSISHSSRIDVFGPASVKPMKNFTAIAGNTLQLHCPAAGYPLESIEWYRKSPGLDDIQSSINRLPQNHRQKSFPNGTLIIERIERGLDDGEYRCMVTSESNVASADTFIRVLVAPVINPFHPPPNLREGMRVMLTCSVVEGDPPLVIQFLKDGIPISMKQQQTTSALDNNHIKFDRTNDYSATLFIESVMNEDSGNYSCIASNLAAIATYSIFMKVNVPPKWIIIPKDTDAIEGQNIAIDCSASGDSRVCNQNNLKQSTMNHFRTVVSNSHIHTAENGSLIFRDIQAEDSGAYLCQANNGVGSGLSKVINLNVHVPAYFKNKFSSQTIRQGESVEFSCEANGESPIDIQISKDQTVLEFVPRNDDYAKVDSVVKILHSDNRYRMERKLRNDHVFYSVRIEQVDRRDSSLFTCVASNPYGKDEYNFQLIVQEPPESPENLHVLELESRRAVITWTQPYSGNSPIIAYHIEYRLWMDSITPWSGVHSMSNTTKTEHFDDTVITLHKSLPPGTVYRKTLPGIETSVDIRSLQPMSTYEFRVQAENQLGLGPFQLTPLKIMTKEEAPSGPPLNIRVFPISAHTLQISFQPPRLEYQNGKILGYYVGYKAIDLDEHFMFKKIVEDNHSVQMKEIKINDLRRATKYLIIVQAFNRIGPGPQSEEIVGETLINDPPKAPILTSVNIGYHSVELQWSIETMDDSFDKHPSKLDVPEITGYYLYSKSPQGDWEENHINSLENSFKYNNLLCGNQYQFYVIAYNNIGKGDPSQAISVRTKGSVPIAPKKTESFITVNSTVAWIRLDQWLVNGCEIKYFLIKYRPNNNKEWLAISSKISPNEQRLVELIDLHPSTWYILNMAAITDIGTTEETYSFSTLTINGATLSPLDTILMQTSSDIGYPSSSKTSTTMMINPIQSMTILVPATCSVIVLTVIILVACFVIRIKRQQYFNPTLRDGAHGPDGPNCMTNNNIPIQSTISNQGKEFNQNNIDYNLPRYSQPTNNFDHCGLCNINTDVSLLKTDYPSNQNRKENIEMLDNGGVMNSDSDYVTLNNPIQIMRTQRTADIKSSNLRSTHHPMSIMKSTINKSNHHRFSMKNQTNNNNSNVNNPNNNNTANIKPNISPMIWLLVSCWKLNLVIN
uniref:Down syndrome cell adhesion molecule-like protein 1 homolog n=1 Tax=Dermatophagoides pteronyssinus TaxID=6956 RepID=A0A6P6YHK3_DERPT|nr:Down syndrome cell adhesion molecule-like protein 1 homolog [Dermatophagoides pteronyssinus]